MEPIKAISMKNIILILTIVLISGKLFAQEEKIVKLLNEQLNAEIKNYEKSDSLRVIKPFYIDANKKLVLETEKYNPNMDTWETKKQEVLLSDIESFDKDINVLFSAKGDKVLVTTKVFNSKKELVRTDITDYNLFFTEIFEEKRNEELRNKIIKAFKKAGYIVNSEYWYD